MEVEVVRTKGVFSLGEEHLEVENNVWLVGDGDRLIVVDASHDPGAICARVAGRRVLAIICTHGHNDHVNAAPALSEAVHAPVALHAEDRMLWDAAHPDRSPDIALTDGDTFRLGGNRLRVIHTPGHSPGGVCLWLQQDQVLFSGDTLFNGGPGATGRPFSDFATIVKSIRTRLLTLDPDTLVHPGHGEDTTIGAEAAGVDGWVARDY